METESRQHSLSVCGAVACLLIVTPLMAQTALADKPLMAEDFFRNVQVLKGIPVNQFMDTMGFSPPRWA